MTTTVKIDAHLGGEKEVKVIITDNGEIVKGFALQDGESAELYVYDGREISVKEVEMTTLDAQGPVDRKVKTQTEAQPDEVKFYYLHDNHTFSWLHGATIDEVLDNAETMAKESRCGMLCPPILLAGGKELRRLKEVAHAPCCGDDGKWLAGKDVWRKECEGDSQVMRLVSSNSNSTTPHDG